MRSIFYTTSDQERDMMLSAKMKKLQFVTPDMLGIPPQFCNRKMWAIAERGTLRNFFMSIDLFSCKR